jgi:uncharacterized membrane protein
MKREHAIYGAYTIFFAVLTGLIIATPLAAFGGGGQALYDAFSYTCHQKLSRSLCVFSDGGSYWAADCTPQNGVLTNAASDRNAKMAVAGNAMGYKMPVCSRDFGIYGAMLLAAVVYPLVRPLGTKQVWPAIWLVIALVPLGIDGGLQLVSETGLLSFVYESSNAVRLLTGALAGFAATFYAIPLLMGMFLQDGAEKKAGAKSG